VRAAVLLPALTLVGGCFESGTKLSIPDQPSAFDVQAAETDAKRYLGAGTKVLAVCGISVGSSLFSDQLEKGFEEDGISDGVIVLAERQDGRPEVLSRDFTKELIVASEDGAQVTRIGKKYNDSTGIWVLQYPSTGVVISYNISTDADGKLLNLWTQNKPAVGPLPPRTSTFLSRCETRS
jgi:hypothetical protein